MRCGRIRIRNMDPDAGGFYHCIGRVTGGEFIFEVRSGRCPVPCVFSVNELWQLDSGGKALFSGELDEQGTVS